MGFFIDIFNLNTFLFLIILVLACALLVAYFESKIRYQNTKITSMLSLVTTLAKELNNVKMNFNHYIMATNSFLGGDRQQNINSGNLGNLGNYNNQLIEVSDDEDNTDDEADETSECELIEDDESDESDDDSDDDNETNNNDSVNDFFDSDDDEHSQQNIKVLKLNISHDLDDNTIDFDENVLDEEIMDSGEIDTIEQIDDIEKIDNSKQFINIEQINDFSETNDLNELDDLHETSDLKKININLEETSHNDIVSEYKKLPVTKLRNIASEKGLTVDSSKLKKNELLKLLGAE